MKTIIILEGPDKVGKTTIKELLQKKLNYKHVIIDRFTGSNYVYSYFHDREQADERAEYLLLERKLFKHIPIFAVYLTATVSELELRFKVTKEKDIAIDDIHRMLTMYKWYIRSKSPLDYLEIDTTEETPEQTVDRIIENFRSWRLRKGY